MYFDWLKLNYHMTCNIQSEFLFQSSVECSEIYSWHQVQVLQFGILLAHGIRYWIELFKQYFTIVDIDNDGTLSLKEFRIILNAFGFRVSDRQSRKLFKEVDTNKNKTVEFDEFCMMVVFNSFQYLLVSI